MIIASKTAVETEKRLGALGDSYRILTVNQVRELLERIGYIYVDHFVGVFSSKTWKGPMHRQG